MSKIFSAGGKNRSWTDNVPGEEVVSTEDNIEKIGVDAMSTDDLRKLAQFSFEVEPPEDVAVEEAVVVDGEPGLEDAPISDEIGGEGDDIDDLDDAELGGDPLDEAAEAVADAQDILDNAAEALTDAGATVEGDDEIAEVPVSVEEDAIDIDEPGDSAVVVEIEEPEAEAGVYSDETASVEASSERFVKIATLSPANKKKLKSYWVKTLGYDSEWVGMMLKEYK
jgi:hypothetical protein